MKIALMGATGFIGSKLLQEALNRGHVVTAVSRTPEKLPPHTNLIPAKADVSDVPSLTNAFRAQEAVIHSYAPPPDPEVRAFLATSGQPPSSYVPRDAAAHEAHVKGRIDAQTMGTRHILEAMQAAGVKRILAVGGAGTLLIDGVRFMDRPGFPVAFEGGVKSTAVVKEILLHQPGVEATVLCPSLVIAPGERTGRFRLGLDDMLFMPDGSSKISVEDFAVAMIDELEQPRHSGRRFTAGY
jgi:hypothetical protein